MCGQSDLGNFVPSEISVTNGRNPIKDMHWNFHWKLQNTAEVFRSAKVRFLKVTVACGWATGFCTWPGHSTLPFVSLVIFPFFLVICGYSVFILDINLNFFYSFLYFNFIIGVSWHIKVSKLYVIKSVRLFMAPEFVLLLLLL